MSDLIEFYRQQALNHLAPQTWRADLQQQAIKQLTLSGWQKNEDWRYTKINNILPYELADKPSSSIPVIPDTLPFNEQILIYQGQIHNLSSLRAQLPKEVIILSLQDACMQHPEQIQPYFEKLLSQIHAMQLLNTCLWQNGLFIYIPPGLQLKDPVVITHWHDQPLHASYYRHLIIAAENSAATIIEDYSGQDACNYMTNTVTEIYLHKQSKIQHAKIQREGFNATHFSCLTVRQQQTSEFTNHLINLGAKLARNDLNIFLEQEHAQARLNGIYLVNKERQVDNCIKMNHLVPNCQSEQDYKGIIADKGQGTFNSKITVAKNAQHSKATQQNKNLLLSPQATINTRPQLEILADDVICTHGATVGQLDTEAIFYLITRGLNSEEARNYLIAAFITINLRILPFNYLASWLINLLTREL